MKSKENFSKKNVKRSGYNDFDDKLKPVKPSNGKSGKRISIYESMDDEFDESELDGVLNFRDSESEDDFEDDDNDFDYDFDDEDKLDDDFYEDEDDEDKDYDEEE